MLGGFVGLLYFGGVRPKPSTVSTMAKQVVTRRGNTAQWSDGPVSFQSIAEDDGHFYEDSRLVVLFFGNLYDKEQLADRLGLPPNVSRAEVFARAWSNWGTGLVEHVDGAFAAAIWKKGTQTLHL